ncbi:MAG: NAD(+)/NADH kinase [Candidatus Poseidoniaceae archaeon]|nr:NAD(+)/NADH kinase [Candidatus Poseidoniaceae archaeon]MBL6896088.1 NAD(+)/NADH kinase [Candidatus Poseidoniaceae archaeon]
MTDVLVVFKKNFEQVHDESLRKVTEILNQVKDNFDVSFDLRAREQVRRADFIGRDLVIVLGGDGTLTSISHNIDAETPVIGVNSHPIDDDPNGSFGFYMDSNIDTFSADLVTALSGKAIINQIPRLQAIIDTTSGNRFTTDPAMNDLLIANTHQYAPSKYHLRRDGNKCRQQSSGLVFSTWLGQGAWLNHIIEQNAIEELRKNIQVDQINNHYFVVAREISHKQRIDQPWSWLDWTDQTTTITSDMHRGYVVPDGWDEVHFNRGATITVNLAAPKLCLLTFRKTIYDKLSDLIEKKLV